MSARRRVDALNASVSMPRSRAGPSLSRPLLCIGFLFLLGVMGFLSVPASGGPGADVNGFVTSIRAVRTGPTEASVVGTSVSAWEPIDLLVNGAKFRSGTTSYNGEYWFVGVLVTDGTTVQTEMTGGKSEVIQVPTFVPADVGPPGFIYRDGNRLMRDGSVVEPFGVNEATAFTWALITWGYNQPQHAGKNQLFPVGPGAQIPGITTPDQLWREYFRYFLHYQQSTDPGSPPPYLLRIWIVDLNWGSFAYDIWETKPTLFYEIFDRMLYWAGRASVYVVPIIGQNSLWPADNSYYDRTSAKYARHIAFSRDVIQHYDGNRQIGMWDLWNEADVVNDAYWATAGGITGYRAWVTGLVADVRSYSTNHLITVGSQQWAIFPGLPTQFGWQKHFLFNDIPGIDVSHEHAYFGVEDQYLIDWRADWGRALGLPYFVGEIGYNAGGIHPIGYGHWPWFVKGWRSTRVGPVADMVWVDNGKGPYYDYPYLGPLPDYPPEGPGPGPGPSPLIPNNAFRGRYFDNEDLTGLKVERIDAAINFDFGLGSPDPSIAPDTFSARWEGYWTFGQGNPIGQNVIYRFNATTDDGIRIWVDNASVMDEWKQQPPTTYLVDVSLTAGVHYVEVEWNELVGGAVAKVSWSFVSALPTPIPNNAFRGRYFDNEDLTALKVERIDAAIDFDFGLGSPDPSIAPDTFSARWEGYWTFGPAGTYRFTVTSDDGIRMWVGNRSVLDQWKQQPPTTYLVDVALTAGVHYVKVEWNELVGGAVAKVSWLLLPTPIPTDAYRGRYFDNEDLTVQKIERIDAAINFDFGTGSPDPSIAPDTFSARWEGYWTFAGGTYRFTATSDDGIRIWVDNASVLDQWKQQPPTTYFVDVPLTAGIHYIKVEWNELVGGAVAKVSWDLIGDSIPPATITDLAIIRVRRTSVTLQWTAPGDDGMIGQASRYDLRYSTSGPITEANFNLATPYQIPPPKGPGSIEQVVVSGLKRGTTYWFAIKTADEVPNWSGVSNSPSTRTNSNCYTCGFGVPPDLFGIEGLGDVLVIGFVVMGLAGAAALVFRGMAGRRPASPQRAALRMERGLWINRAR